MAPSVEAARSLAKRGWPVLPVQPGGKQPLTAHGVKDASTDLELVANWWRRWPDANVGVATGYPGPQVLDIDDPEGAAEVLGMLANAPAVATARGRHLYLLGLAEPTVALPYGELRGRGSYVVAPPSVHPSGREYVWLLEPVGRALPPVPAMLRNLEGAAGRGEHPAPVEPVPHHFRHPYLRDFTVRLVRAGVTDPARIAAHLATEFELACEPLPVPKPGYFEALGRWGARSRIARRERAL